MSRRRVPRPVDAALAYAERGWLVFPCHSAGEAGCSCRRPDCSSPGKHPRISGGLRNASSDQAVIRRWWTRWPNANVAVRTGEVSGVVVLDIDPDHGGDDALAQLVRRHEPLPAGPAVRTGSGGLHLYFEHPGPAVRNSAGSLGPGIDVRGDGGYVIAPPSRHASGASYEWQTTGALPALPEWLLAAMHRAEPALPRSRGPIRLSHAISAWARAALDDEANRVRTASEGTRNSTLNRAAFCLGQIIGAGHLDAETVEQILIDNALAAGLGARESRTTVRSGLRAGMISPRSPRPLNVPTGKTLGDTGVDAAELL